MRGGGRDRDQGGRRPGRPRRHLGRPQVRLRRGGPDQPGVHRAGRRGPADLAGRRAGHDGVAGGRGRRPSGQRVPRRRREPAPAGALQRRLARRNAGRGGAFRQNPGRVPGTRRVDHRRARRRRGQGPVHAQDVQRRRPGHHAIGPVRVRPGSPVQPRQDLPHPPAVRRGSRPPPRWSFDGGGRPGGDLLMNTERGLVLEVRSALSAACPSLRDGEPGDAVGGLTPGFVACPASTQEAAALLRAAAAAGLAVVPRGAGTGLGWGLPPSACDLVVDLSAMDQVVDHAAGELVARVQAGATFGGVASVLAKAGQELALDVPAEATIGGVVATGTAGPRRLRYGSPRDLLIGVTAVRADGVIAHAGGKVVKNVAGYDIGKLLAGSQGTLALITEATFRLHPLPEAVAYVTAECGPAERGAAAAALQAAAASALVPSAAELDWPPGSPQSPRALRVGGLVEGTSSGVAGRVGVLLEGTSSGVAERAGLMSELLASAGGSPAVAVADAAPPRWGQLPSGS